MPQSSNDTTATVGSGNVFADIGVPDPDLALAKAQLAGKIFETIRAHGWTQVQAARAMGVDQPKISEIVRGQVRGYTVDRLMGYLIRLGQSVTFTFTSKSPADEGKLKLAKAKITPRSPRSVKLVRAKPKPATA